MFVFEHQVNAPPSLLRGQAAKATSRDIEEIQASVQSLLESRAVFARPVL
jgi:hypothetical protein